MSFSEFTPNIDQSPSHDGDTSFEAMVKGLWRPNIAWMSRKRETKDLCIQFSSGVPLYLAKVEWTDVGDDSGIAEMKLQVQVRGQWQHLSTWKAKRSSSCQHHEIPSRDLVCTSQWRLYLVSKHGPGDHMKMKRLVFFKLDMPREESFANEDDWHENVAQTFKTNRTMWEDKKFTDVAFICGSQTVDAHRCMVAAASPVFCKMLESGMKETQSQEIALEDVDIAVVESMVKFMYISMLDEDMPGEVYAALVVLGHKFMITGLVQEACSMLHTALSVDNIISVVQTIQPYKEDDMLRPVFLLIMQAIQQDSKL
eukprot:TRINITY_DN107034_c0_g1_i1.p1 TRINITY_DN107034_c0_g1~~TRINITY_DN107034_c0_g1_i1.p1  ORF type:complete len:312 (-),score=57.57 TRINITY_DN107034_c0_g1_i1:1-936(-)